MDRESQYLAVRRMFSDLHVKICITGGSHVERVHWKERIGGHGEEVCEISSEEEGKRSDKVKIVQSPLLSPKYASFEQDIEFQAPNYSRYETYSDEDSDALPPDLLYIERVTAGPEYQAPIPELTSPFLRPQRALAPSEPLLTSSRSLPDPTPPHPETTPPSSPQLNLFKLSLSHAGGYIIKSLPYRQLSDYYIADSLKAPRVLPKLRVVKKRRNGYNG